MELHYVALAIENRRHLIELLRDVVEISSALSLFLGDDRIATAVPAERLAEWDVKVEREIARLPVICDQFFGKLRPGDLLGEFRSGWIGSITWPGNIIFSDEIEINVKLVHISDVKYRLSR